MKGRKTSFLVQPSFLPDPQATLRPESIFVFDILVITSLPWPFWTQSARSPSPRILMASPPIRQLFLFLRRIRYKVVFCHIICLIFWKMNFSIREDKNWSNAQLSAFSICQDSGSPSRAEEQCADIGVISIFSLSSLPSPAPAEWQELSSSVW